MKFAYPQRGRTLYAFAIGTVVCVGRAIAQVPALTNDELLGSLPADLKMVVVAHELTRWRPTPQGQAIERFMGEASDWSHTGAAWNTLATALRMPAEEGIGAILGRHVLLMARDRPEGGMELGLITSVKPAVERRLRERLGYIPRGFEQGVTVFSVEEGDLQVAAFPVRTADDGQSWSRLLVSPDERLFEEVRFGLGGAGMGRSIQHVVDWDRVKPMLNSDLFLLVKEAEEIGDSIPYFALAANATEGGWEARFIATDTMVTGGLASLPEKQIPWPAEAVDALEQDATLLIAGAPSTPVEGQMPQLLGTLLGLLRLPPPLAAAIDGNLIIACDLAEPGALPPPTPGAQDRFVVALPIRDVGQQMTIADGWCRSVAGLSPAETKAVTLDEGIRTAEYRGTGPTLASRFMTGKSEVSWCYAAASVAQDGRTPGWLVVAVQAEGAAAQVRRIANMLTHDVHADTATVFRLVLKPDPVAKVLWANVKASDLKAAVPAPAANTINLPGPRQATRWLNRVESRVQRDTKGMVGGSLIVKMNLPLLKDPEQASTSK